MLYSNDRGKMRDVFFHAWQKHLDRLPLDAMEQLIVDVTTRHPELHSILEDPDANRHRDHFPETGDGNPFFHLGMHLTLIEQMRLNQPAGIRDAMLALVSRTGDEHHAQHIAIDILATWLGEGPPHDENDYVERIRLATPTSSRRPGTAGGNHPG